ncbi:MAG: 3'-5' exonuclease [Candidatus Kariarchaeaceae archaeon]
MENNRIDEIYVIDTETSGIEGFPHDLVYEIGICCLQIESGDIEPVYNQILGYDENELTKDQKKAWIFQNSTLMLDDVLNARKAEIIALEIRELLHKKYIAFFNCDFDYEKFLQHAPFSLKDGENCYLLPCIMKELTPICKLTNPYYGGYKWPKLVEALEVLFTDEELQDFNQTLDRHRALSDAYESAKCLYKLVVEYDFLDKIGK